MSKSNLVLVNNAIGQYIENGGNLLQLNEAIEQILNDHPVQASVAALAILRAVGDPQLTGWFGNGPAGVLIGVLQIKFTVDNILEEGFANDPLNFNFGDVSPSNAIDLASGVTGLASVVTALPPDELRAFKFLTASKSLSVQLAVVSVTLGIASEAVAAIEAFQNKAAEIEAAADRELSDRNIELQTLVYSGPLNEVVAEYNASQVAIDNINNTLSTNNISHRDIPLRLKELLEPELFIEKVNEFILAAQDVRTDGEAALSIIRDIVDINNADRQIAYTQILATQFDRMTTAKIAAITMLQSLVAEAEALADDLDSSSQLLDENPPSMPPGKIPEEIEEKTMDGQNSAFNPVHTPLVLDLDGDGIELLDLAQSNALFDLNADGFATHVAFVGPNDGFLALDVNEDGLINDVSELFGFPFDNGFDKLAGYDDNNDGVIDSQDAVFDDLLVFRDISGDGVSQAFELNSLAFYDIASLSLSNVALSPEEGDAVIAFQGSYALTDGTVREFSDAVFASSKIDSEFIGDVTIDPATDVLPDIKGHGFMPDLQIALNLDADLRSSVENLLTITDVSTYQADFEQMLFKWADVENITFAEIVGHRGPDLFVNSTLGYVNFMNTAVILSFEQLGLLKNYVGLDNLDIGDGTGLTDNLTSSGELYASAVQLLVDDLFTKFLVTSGVLGSELSALVTYDKFTDTLNFELDPSAPASYFALADKIYEVGSPLLEKIHFIETVLAYSHSSAVHVFRETMLSRGGPADDLMLGTDGDDLINGGGGADTILSGIGSDTINGGAGNDDITLTNSTDDTNIVDSGEGDDVVRVASEEGGTQSVFLGAGHDSFYGSGHDNNSIEGGDGNDTIEIHQLFSDLSRSTNSVNSFEGGKGDDVISSLSGEDTYTFNRGDGEDTVSDTGSDPFAKSDSIVFGAGIVQGDVTATTSGNDIIIEINDPAGIEVDTIRLVNSFADPNYEIETYEFSDGSSLTAADIRTLALTITGTENDDSITATSGLDETIMALGGNDIIISGSGADVIYGGAGDDVIDSYSGADSVYGGDGNDEIKYHAGNSVLGYFEGGAGDDYIHFRSSHGYPDGQYTSHTFKGGLGDDTFSNLGSSDTYIYNQGDGTDEIRDYDFGYGTTDKIVFGAGIVQANLLVSNNGSDLVIDILDPSDPAATDQITIKDAYVAVNNEIELIEFDDGSSLSAADLKTLASTIYGTEGNDAITRTGNDETIFALGGNDTLIVGNGNDIIDGGAGDDVIDSYNGTDIIFGGDGNDEIKYHPKNSVNNVFYGGAGDDYIHFRSSVGYVDSQYTSHTFEGGTGDDVFSNMASADTYIYNRGDGTDEIRDYDYGYGTTDKIVFGAGIVQANLLVSNNGSDLVIDILDPSDPTATDQITIKDAYVAVNNEIELLEFADGSTLTAAEMIAIASVVYGTEGDDSIAGTYGVDETIMALGGNDSISSSGSDDEIYGGAGNDTILVGTGTAVVYGDAGDDVIDSYSGQDSVYGGDGNDEIKYHAGSSVLSYFDGGAGDDYIHFRSSHGHATGQYTSHTFKGGLGDDTFSNLGSSDTYLYNRGDGSDEITDQDYGYGTEDKIVFGIGIVQSDLVITSSGADLVIDITDPSDPLATDQIVLKSAYTTSNNEIELLEFADGSTLTAAEMIAIASVVYGTEGDDSIAGTYGVDETIMALGGNDSISSSGSDDEIHGGAGNDAIISGSGADVIYGGAGDDVVDSYSGQDSVYGGDGNDEIKYHAGNSVLSYFEGGAGDDYIHYRSSHGHQNGQYTSHTFKGGLGNDTFSNLGSSDTYLYDRGDGSDEITDQDFGYGTTDKIVFGAGIVQSDLVITSSGADLIIDIADPSDPLATDQIVLKSAYTTSNNEIELLEFADGSTLTAAEMNAIASVVYGTEGDDSITGTGGVDETIMSLGGNDTIDSVGSNDEIYGGAGNDTLIIGSGNDIIDGGTGDDLIDSYNGTDTIFGGDGNDEVKYHPKLSVNNVFNGGAGDDYIHYRSSVGYVDSQYTSHTFEGGTGDDVFSNLASADTYIYNRGDGSDEIRDYDYGYGTTDKIVLGAGIVQANLLVSNNGSDLIIDILDPSDLTATDQITIKDAYVAVNNEIELIEFVDGSSITAAELKTLAGTIYGGTGDDVIAGTSNDDILNGLAGNDTLNAGTGDDVLIGGDGSDIYKFDAGSGADTIIESGATSNNVDIFEYASTISYDSLWFKQAGDDLVIGQIGLDDEVTIEDWYVNDGYKVETFETDQGTLSYQDVQTLVNAMSGYADPTGSSGSITQVTIDLLAPTLVSAWDLF